MSVKFNYNKKITIIILMFILSFSSIKFNLLVNASVIEGSVMADSQTDDPFEFLPPLSDIDSNKFDFDDSLLTFLRIEIYELDGDEIVSSSILVLDHENDYPSKLRVSKSKYQSVWTPSDPFRDYRIKVFVGDYEIGSIDVFPAEIIDDDPSIPIIFRVGNDPTIRIQMLIELESPPGDIAAVLQEEFGYTPEETAFLMFENGFSILEITQGLKDSYFTPLGDVVPILLDLGYSINDVVFSLHSIYAADASEIGAALLSLGFDLVTISDALILEFSLELEDITLVIVEITHEAYPSMSMDEIAILTASTLRDVFTVEITTFVESTPLNLTEISISLAGALKEVFSLTYADLADLARAVAVAMKEAFGLVKAEMFELARAVGAAMKEVFSMTKAQMVDLARAVGGALKEAFSLVASDMMELARAVAGALKEIFSLVASDIMELARAVAVGVKEALVLGKSSLMELARAVAVSVKEALVLGKSSLFDLARAVGGALKEVFSLTYADLADLARAVAVAMKEALSLVSSDVVDLAKALINALKEELNVVDPTALATSVLQALKSVFASLPDYDMLLALAESLMDVLGVGIVVLATVLMAASLAVIGVGPLVVSLVFAVLVAIFGEGALLASIGTVLQGVIASLASANVSAVSAAGWVMSALIDALGLVSASGLVTTLVKTLVLVFSEGTIVTNLVAVLSSIAGALASAGAGVVDVAKSLLFALKDGLGIVDPTALATTVLQVLKAVFTSLTDYEVLLALGESLMEVLGVGIVVVGTVLMAAALAVAGAGPLIVTVVFAVLVAIFGEGALLASIGTVLQGVIASLASANVSAVSAAGWVMSALIDALGLVSASGLVTTLVKTLVLVFSEGTIVTNLVAVLSSIAGALASAGAGVVDVAKSLLFALKDGLGIVDPTALATTVLQVLKAVFTSLTDYEVLLALGESLMEVLGVGIVVVGTVLMAAALAVAGAGPLIVTVVFAVLVAIFGEGALLASIGPVLQGIIASLASANVSAVNAAGWVMSALIDALGLVSASSLVTELVQALVAVFTEGTIVTYLVAVLSAIGGALASAGAAIEKIAWYFLSAIESEFTLSLVEVATTIAQVLVTISSSISLLDLVSLITNVLVSFYNLTIANINELAIAVTKSVVVALGLGIGNAGQIAVAVAKALVANLPISVSSINQLAIALAKALNIALGLGLANLDTFTSALANALRESLGLNLGHITQIAIALAQGLNSTLVLTLSEAKSLAIAIAGALVGALGLGLGNINVLAVSIAEALISVFTLTNYQLISWVADALMSVFTLSASELLSALVHVLSELSKTLSNTDLAQILKNRLFTSTEISEALKIILGLTSDVVASILKSLSYTATTIATVLKNVFSESANRVAEILMDLSYSASTIATAVKTAFSLTATGVALVLKHIGQGLDAIVTIIMDLFSMTWEAAMAIVSAIF